MGSPTTNYGWTKPTVGADTDAWGGELNTDLDGIDSTVFTVSGVANAALPAAGGTLTGPLTGTSATFSGAVTAASLSAPQAIGDNRIINGDMRIDQRNNGASGTAQGYTIDRWFFDTSPAGKGTWGRNLNAIGGPVGFPYYLGFQSSSAYTVAAGDGISFGHYIEADMVSDFAWGIASAQSVTLSFWARSSLTGTFGGAIQNYAGTRAYPFSFSLPTANTWTKIAITIPGDTAGTWVMSGNVGSMAVVFDLGAGATYRGPANAWMNGSYIQGVTGAVNVVSTNAAAFYMTGVKVEVGSVATPFNHYSLAKSMADCQRYYQALGGVQAGDVMVRGYQGAIGNAVSCTMGITQMRATPTATAVGPFTLTNTTALVLAPSYNTLGLSITATAVGQTSAISAGTNTYITLSAEL